MDARSLAFVLFLTTTFTTSWTQPDNECKDGRPCKRYFKYTINNQLQPPFFKSSMFMKAYPFVHMIRYMEWAVLEKPAEFVNFKATFTSPYGYFISEIHNLAGAYSVNKTYWEISNSSGPLDVGVSTYIPSPGDNILFNFTQGGHLKENGLTNN